MRSNPMIKDFSDEIRNIKVTPDEIKAALLVIDKMTPEDREEYTKRCTAIAKTVDLLEREEKQRLDKNTTEEKPSTPKKATAIQIRIHALSSVLTHPEIKALSFEVSNGDDKYIMIHENVLTATARTPLHKSADQNENTGYFESGEFLKQLQSFL